MRVRRGSRSMDVKTDCLVLLGPLDGSVAGAALCAWSLRTLLAARCVVLEHLLLGLAFENVVTCK